MLMVSVANIILYLCFEQSGMALSQLQKSCENISAGRTASTYMIVGSGLESVHAALTVICAIFRSAFSGLSLHDQKTAVDALNRIAHPDVHFFYPTNSTSKVKKASSSDFIKEWRAFMEKGKNLSLSEWYLEIGLGNKQGVINIGEAEKISKLSALKSFQGGPKVFVIWMAEKMNISTSNKLLKLLEEPPEKTVFILCCESEHALLETISSRCQKINLNASQNLDVVRLSQRFDSQFVRWLRAAFKAKKDKKAINELLAFSESISKETREEQRAFLSYCSEIFRDSLHYRTKSEDSSKKHTNELDLKKFAPFVNELNINGFYLVLQKAFEDIGRNGNPKIIFTDISIELTRLLHKKASQVE
tara:strand:- start:1431 stop:2513 length:1083 start_codon:yes stop_codon:yes gene_type:complete